MYVYLHELAVLLFVVQNCGVMEGKMYLEPGTFPILELKVGTYHFNTLTK